MSDDAIVQLRNEHKQIRQMFRDLAAARDAAPGEKGRVAWKMLELLTVHTYVENEVMYPEVRRMLPEVEDDVLESYQEHHVADLLAKELWSMSPQDEQFDAKAAVLMQGVRRHMDAEENEWFPRVRAGLGRNQLQELGRQMNEARVHAPTTPSEPSALKKAIDAIMS